MGTKVHDQTLLCHLLSCFLEAYVQTKRKLRYLVCLLIPS